MGDRKWGESFLKSGLPLEHLTLVTLRTLDWSVEPHAEYSRKNREGGEAWFEVDIRATHPRPNRDTFLELMIECKYHDLSRFWMLLPSDPQGRWMFNDRVFNCGPFETLAQPRDDSALALAPPSTWGVVVSQDGTKQDNAIHAAVQQLANAFVPMCASKSFAFDLDMESPSELPTATATVPIVVTNASLFRLKPEIRDLEVIRAASSPSDIAEEIAWTWYYHDPSISSYDANLEVIEKHIEDNRGLVNRYPSVTKRLMRFADRPNWIAIVNVKSLAPTVTSLADHFLGLEMEEVKSVVRREVRRARKARSRSY
jgi:hypothetical protein